MKVDQLIQDLKRDLRPVAPVASLKTRLSRWIGVAVLCLMIGVLMMGVREDVAARLHDPYFVLITALILLTSVLAATSAFILSVPGLERTARHRALPLITFGFGALLLVVLALNEWEGAALDWGFTCVRDALFLSVVPGLVLFWMIRRAAPLRSRVAGAFVTLSMAALGAVGTQLTCHNDAPLHLLLWHIGPVLLIGLIGAGLGGVLLRGANSRRKESL